MSSGHDHHDKHSVEPVTVSFRTPMILALVTTFIILLCANIYDSKHSHSDSTKGKQEGSGRLEFGGHDKNDHERRLEKREEANRGASEGQGLPADSTLPTGNTESGAAGTGAPANGEHH